MVIQKLSNPGDRKAGTGAYEVGRNGVVFIAKLAITEFPGGECYIAGISTARDGYVHGGFHNLQTMDVIALCRSFLESKGYDVLAPDNIDELPLLQPMHEVHETPRAVIFCTEGGTPEIVYCDQPLRVIAVEVEGDGFDGEQLIVTKDNEVWGLHYGVGMITAPQIVNEWYGYVAQQHPDYEI